MSGLHRIIVHWTAGGGRASDLDREHYHRLVEWDGNIVAGTKTPEDNIVASDGDYAGHTRNLNTGSIGVALCGMRGAKEFPFDPGPTPINEKQWRAAAVLVADLCRTYGIPVTGRTVLTHAEVEPVLGVKQAGKWDIARIPWKPSLVGAVPVGDDFRDLVRSVLGAPIATDRPNLRRGSRGAFVRDLQEQLSALGYALGAIDGHFGRNTEASVLAFQAATGLATDGIVGPSTWAALEKAKPRPDRDLNATDLRTRGSETLRGADVTQGAVTIGGGLAVIDQISEAADKASGILPTINTMITDQWPALLAIGACVGVVLLYTHKIKAARVRDARSGAHLGR